MARFISAWGRARAQARTLRTEQKGDSVRGKRDRAILAQLIGCGLRRTELVGLGLEDFQVREEHDRRSDWQGKAHSHHASSGVGETRCR